MKSNTVTSALGLRLERSKTCHHNQGTHAVINKKRKLSYPDAVLIRVDITPSHLSTACSHTAHYLHNSISHHHIIATTCLVPTWQCIRCLLTSAMSSQYGGYPTIPPMHTTFCIFVLSTISIALLPLLPWHKLCLIFSASAKCACGQYWHGG